MDTYTTKIAAVMTAARYENTLARNTIETALKKLDIPLTVSGGVYYGQCMQIMLEQLAATECDLVVTVDGDSMFTAEQLQRLVNIAHQEDRIDALAALQIRRGKMDMLGTSEGKRQLEWEGYPIKVTTAHFGLTVIKLDKLRSTPKPWFMSKPDKDGSWGTDKVDDDVFFWFQWKEAGNSIYIDPGTRLGHLEEMVTTYDENLVPCHLYPKEWFQQYASNAN